MKKGLQKLNDDDFRDHHLYELLREKGPAEKIGELVFHDRMATITPFPAGRVSTGSAAIPLAATERTARGKHSAGRPRRSSSSARTPTTT